MWIDLISLFLSFLVLLFLGYLLFYVSLSYNVDICLVVLVSCLAFTHFSGLLDNAY